VGTQRININFPDDVAEDLKRLVPEGQRSSVVVEATRRELERIRRKGAYESLLDLRRSAQTVPAGDVLNTLRKIRRAR
jgi:hypothetical protein